MQRSVEHAWVQPLLRPLGIKLPDPTIDVRTALIRLAVGCFHSGQLTVAAMQSHAAFRPQCVTPVACWSPDAPGVYSAESGTNGLADLQQPPRMEKEKWPICASGRQCAKEARSAYFDWFVGVGLLLMCPGVTTQHLEACCSFQKASASLLEKHNLLKEFPDTLKQAQGKLPPSFNAIPHRINRALPSTSI